MGEFLTQLWPLGATVLVILAAAVLIALIVVLVRAAKTMKNINVITQEAEEKVTPALKRVEPLLDRAELTVDTLNLELLRVDSILEDVESVTDVAGKTADTVNTLTAAPSDAVASVVDRVRGALASRRKNKGKEERFVYPIGANEKGAPATGAAASVPSGQERDPEADAAGPTYEDLKAAASAAAEKISPASPAPGDPSGKTAE